MYYKVPDKLLLMELKKVCSFKSSIKIIIKLKQITVIFILKLINLIEISKNIL